MRAEMRRALHSPDTRAVIGLVAFIIAFFAPGWLSPQTFWTDGQFNAYYAAADNWSDAWIGGWPAGADTAAFVWYPLRILLRSLHFSFDAFVVAAYVIAALGTYAYLRLLSVSTIAAIAGALEFALCGFMIAQLGHTSMVQAAAWLPPILAGVEGAISRGQRRWAFLAAISVAMALLAGHMQIAFYGLVVVAAYCTWRLHACWQQKRMYAWSLALLGATTGLLVASPQILMTAGYVAETPRVALDYQMFIAFSLPPFNLPTVLFPYLLGDGSFTGQPFFGLSTYVESCFYMPFLAFALAIPALQFRRSIASFWLLVALVALLLALGGALPWLAHAMFHLPGFNLFRAPARHVMEASLAMSVLTGLGAQALLDASAARARAYLAIAIALALAVVLISVPAWGFLASHVTRNVALQPWLRNPAIGVGLIGIASGVAAVAILVRRFRYWSAAFLAAVVVGLASFGAFSYWRYTFRPPLQVGPIESSLAAELRSTGGRFLYTQWQWNPDLSAARAVSLGMRSVNWYGPLVPVRAKELLRMDESGMIGATTLADENAALDLYGVRIAAVRVGKDATTTQMSAPRWQRIGEESGVAFFRNQRALPLGWLTPAWRNVQPGEALGVIQDTAKEGFDPRHLALVEGIAEGGSAEAQTGNVDIAWDGAAALHAKIDTPAPAFLVVSINGLAGWHATVDGVPQPTYRTDHALLGLPIDAGRHEVVLRYRVPMWQWAVPWAGALLAMAIIVRLPRSRVRPEREDARGSQH